NMTRCLLGGAGLLLANLAFLMPRRPVEITVEQVNAGDLPELTREKLNPYFEAWYNAEGPEPARYIPYHFLLGPRSYEFPRPPGGLTAADLSRVKAHTRERVLHILAEKLHRPLSDNEQRPETGLDQLGLDSLDRMELTLRVEQEFGFSADLSPATLGELWALAAGLVERAAPKPPPREWFRPIASEGPLTVLGETLA